MTLSKFFIILLTPIYLFSYDLNFNKKFNKSALPTTIFANLSISYSYDNEQIVNKTLLKYIKEIEEEQSMQNRQTNYFIRKNIIYTNSTPIDKGYIGEVSYELSSSNYQDIDSLIYKLYEMRVDNALSIMTSNLNWSISETQKSILYDNIREDAQTWAINYIQYINKKFNTICKLTSISESKNQIDHYSKRMTAMSFNESSKSNDILPFPKKEPIEFSKDFNFNYECK